MQTFLPFADPAASAEALDDRRLNKQRSDIIQLLKKLDPTADFGDEPAFPEDPAEKIEEPKVGRKEEHPLVKMWRGNEGYLIANYATAVIIEWMSRGNPDNLLQKIRAYMERFPEESFQAPEWLGDEEFHQSHKAYLSRLAPLHYNPKWPDVKDDMPLIWPRSPKSARFNPEVREHERKVKKAMQARDKAEIAMEKARKYAIEAGLDPDTFEEYKPEVVTIGTPDADLLEL